MTVRDRALVFGVDSQIGLSVVRELNRYHVEVYGVGHSSRAVSLFSRALTKGWVLEPGLDRVSLVNKIACDYDVPFLLAVGESDIEHFNARRHALHGIRPLIPTPDKMSIVLDKMRVAELATEIGIEVPATHRPESTADVDELVKKVTYPVVLKWSNPLEVSESLRANRLKLEKKRFSYDEVDLTRALHRYDPLGLYPLVQSYVPGHGIGHMLFMADGEPLLRFRHRRIHEWPPDGGSSSLCVSEPPDGDPELMEKSIALLKRIGWDGAAMVEYRHDPITDRSVLMEINGRFWGSLPLAYHAGAPFAWLTYAVLGKGEHPSIPPYRSGVRCGFVVPEVKRLHRLLFRRHEIEDRTFRYSRLGELAGFVRNYLDPRLRHYIFEWRDPLPAIADAWNGLRAVITRRRSAP